MGCGYSRVEVSSGNIASNDGRAIDSMNDVHARREQTKHSIDKIELRDKPTENKAIKIGCISSAEEVSFVNKASPDGKGVYSRIDAHAKRAPSKLKSSVSELVSYMQQCTKDHKLLVRGFFVWISENIMYDLEGLRGYRQMSGVDTQSVMKSGLTVCEGYANVMKDLCEEAGIPVKKISGFSKGAGYDPAVPFSETSRTDHAWNAVQLDGKWHLLDSTWGTGHDNGREYVKEFEEFYFLTKPEEFVNDHFPYMNENMDESMRWQLLTNPVTLEEFSKSVWRKSHAFALGLIPKSHMEGHISMKDEITIQLNTKRKEQLFVSASLMQHEEGFTQEQQNATFCTYENGYYTVYVHPTAQGKYTLDIFSDIATDNETSMPQVMCYALNCASVKESDFEFPYKFGSKLADRCKIVKPRNGRLPANSMVTYEVVAPTFKGVSVNEIMLQKKGEVFVGTIKTGGKDKEFTLSSVVTKGYVTSFDGLFHYHTV